MTYCSYCGTTFDRYHECAESGLRITPRRERSPADEAALEAFMDGARAARENAAEIAAASDGHISPSPTASAPREPKQ